MRVAYLINQYPKVSHTFIRREILALERQGHEVVRIALRGWDDELMDEEDEAERERTRYVLQDGMVPLLLAVARMVVVRPVRFMRAFKLASHMSRKAERPLPIHLIYLAEACRIALWLQAAGVQHLHAHFGTNPAEIAMQVHVLGGPRWSFTVHGPEEFDKALLIGLAEKIRRCSFVVAICSYGRSQLYRLISHEHWPKVEVIHCGVEPAFFSNIADTTPIETRLVCIGRLCEQKGQLMLIEASRRLSEDGIEFNLVLVGDGDMRAEIETLVASYELQTKVRITGWVSNDQVRGELLSARALVLPSFAEGLPVVIMEAMALRRPVISTFVGGIPELITSGEHGWLVPAGDVERLAIALRACLEGPPDLLERMGSAALQRVSERHNLDMEVRKLARLFSSPTELKSHA